MKYDSSFIAYVFVGVSFSQFLGILSWGFNLWQASIIFALFCLVVMVPGFLEWSALQKKMISPLSSQQIISCLMPSLVGISFLFFGFLVGTLAGN